MKKRIINYAEMARRLVLYYSGKGYFQYTPRIADDYTPNKMGAYFYDFTVKTKWPHREKDGIPVTKSPRTFPTIVIQKALGHFNLYIKTGKRSERKKFLKLSDWIVKNTDKNGGIITWEKYSCYKNEAEYSAMTQAMAVSVLIRAYRLTKKRKYKVFADKTAIFLIYDKKNGLVKKEGGYVILEEFPIKRFSSILNGWIFSIFGIYEYYLFTKNKDIFRFLRQTLSSLDHLLPRYDLGYWSLYDLSGNIASDFYQRSHVALLSALYITFPEYRSFKQYKLKFEDQLKKPMNRFISQLKKIGQKLMKPTETIF